MDRAISYVYEADKIVEHLYQGPWPPMGRYLKDNGYDVVVLAASDNQCIASTMKDIEVVLCPTDDDTRKNRVLKFVKMWREAAKRVVECVRENKNVLVTCVAGQNRSSMVTAFALAELTGWSGKKIVEHIHSCRPSTFSNSAFVDLIVEMFPEVKDKRASSMG